MCTKIRFFILFVIVNPMLYAQDSHPNEKRLLPINIYKDPINKSQSIRRGDTILWDSVRFIKSLGTYYQILTKTNERLIIDGLGYKQEILRSYVCGTQHHKGRKISEYRLEETDKKFLVVLYKRYENGGIYEKIKIIDSISKRGIKRAYYYNGQKNLRIREHNDFDIGLPNFQNAVVLEKGRKKGIWLKWSLEFFDDVAYHKGLFKVWRKKQVGFYLVTPIRYKEIEDFKFCLARFILPDGKAGYVDTKGLEHFD